jgi:gliding motility-associated-like protein
MIPEITPLGPLSVCSGTPLRINATVSRGTTYEWKNETTNTVVATGTNAYYDVTATGKYSVTAIAEGGTCSQVSNVVEITVGAGLGGVSGPAVASNNGPLCVGNAMQLSVSSVGGSQYKWSGPNGYTGTGLTPAPISNFGLEHVGRYTVEIFDGGCIVQTTSTVVEAIDIGNFTVSYTGSRFLCQGNTKTLTVVPDLVGASYQWYEQTAGILSGQQSVSLTVNATGNYYARIGYPGCSNSQTDVVNIVVASNPVAGFSMPASGCAGQLIQFTNQSVIDPNATAEYLWTFGDGNTSTLENPQHTYLTAGNFNAKLRVTYQGGVCPNETSTKPISIQSAPVPVIASTSGEYEICPGESLTLQVVGSYNSYEWSTGATTPTINVTEGGNYTVEVTTTTCTLNATRDIDEFAAPALLVSATPPNIGEGQTSQLNVDGLSTYLWTPESSLSDPTIANPIASPSATTLYTVSGEDGNGCFGEGSVTVSVKGDAVVTKLTPKKYFSPNDDVTNQFWTVDNIIEYPQCGVVIYDEKGIKLFEAKPYLNDWNGITMKGQRLPDGVYYYIIRCDGEESMPKTGSITLLR